MVPNIGWFLLSGALVAFFYGAVGHGGASGYLALMALFGFAPSAMKPIALLLNIFVAGVAFINYARQGFFNRKLFAAFSITSIPAAYIGGGLNVAPDLYKKLLAVVLLFAVARMLWISQNETKDFCAKPINYYLALVLGAFVGLFSGVIGIGGGIILSPLILLLSWGKIKETAGVSALFIALNSISGLLAQVQQGVVFDNNIVGLVLIVLGGGFVGSLWGSKYVQNKHLTLLLSGVLLLAVLKLFYY